jgi:hypothetical protein
MIWVLTLLVLALLAAAVIGAQAKAGKGKGRTVRFQARNKPEAERIRDMVPGATEPLMGLPRAG